MSRDFDALFAYLAARAPMPFVWGENDCVTFAAGAVKALTGADLLADLGVWTDEASASAAVAARGGLEAAVSGLLTPIAPSLAQRGDVVAVKSPDGIGLLLMIVEGHSLVGPGANRIRRLPRRCAVLAWSAA